MKTVLLILLSLYMFGCTTQITIQLGQYNTEFVDKVKTTRSNSRLLGSHYSEKGLIMAIFEDTLTHKIVRTVKK